ncbi:nuclear transport factor 2 family protein [Fibrisoma montanum]|uniref:Nuclear transport factor 2 family protein n=1 Tax=Fibrisoma montanum TaxID=2305895 RepID=A0A418MK39_9BACT|nr:nuclear transport factor 2 family protein [Fibrisoma montanum]RIV27774.1 nuclear transport factor 2 family protein [Fibrisoma montanum]
MEHDIKAIAHKFIHTLQNRTSTDELIPFYHPDIEQIEFPNAITRTTAIRNLDDLKAASERGQQVMQKEEYKVTRSYVFDNTVIIEAIWTGTLAIPLGSIPIGGQMQANFAQFYDFKDGLIIRQRNYDCFQPF